MPFFGVHQAGIDTPQQQNMLFAAFDLTTDDQEWMGNGTYIVARRIRMLVEVWDRSSLQDQEQSIGRVKISGAPLGSEDEFDPLQRRLAENDALNEYILHTGSAVFALPPGETLFESA